MIYWNTKEMISDRVIKPVLKRTNSFSDIAGHALIIADQAVDKYLPDDSDNNNDEDKVDGVNGAVGDVSLLTSFKKLIINIYFTLGCISCSASLP